MRVHTTSECVQRVCPADDTIRCAARLGLLQLCALSRFQHAQPAVMRTALKLAIKYECALEQPLGKRGRHDPNPNQPAALHIGLP